jgi:hypothetical protein
MSQKDDSLLEPRIKVLRASQTVVEAAGRLGTKSGALSQYFSTRAPPASDYLAAPLVPGDYDHVPPQAPAGSGVVLVDPVERRQAETKAARVVREHRDLTSEVSALREALEIHAALAAAPLTPIVRRELGSGLREGAFVAMLSDTHVEERVEPSPYSDNVYNLAIADLRLSRFFAGVEHAIWFHRDSGAPNDFDGERRRFAIREGTLWIGGDIVSGHIHDENVETSAFPPIAACLWAQPRLVAGIRGIVARCGLERLQVVFSYGNHGRDTHKPRRATGAHHSYEWNMYQQIAQQLSDDPRISCLANPHGHQYTRAYDFDLHWHHGDECKYLGGSGGITIPINKAVAAWDRVRAAHYHHFGHFHQLFDGGNWAVNGSLIGFNAYAMSIKASPEPPQQTFYMLDSKRGKTCKWPIWVGDPAAELALWDGGKAAA